VQRAVCRARQSREAPDDWAKGFYKGLAMAYNHSGQNFKRLQKDIEAKKCDGYDLCLVMSKYPISRVKASLTGGKNG